MVRVNNVVKSVNTKCCECVSLMCQVCEGLDVLQPVIKCLYTTCGFDVDHMTVFLYASAHCITCTAEQNYACHLVTVIIISKLLIITHFSRNVCYLPKIANKGNNSTRGTRWHTFFNIRNLVFKCKSGRFRRFLQKLKKILRVVLKWKTCINNVFWQTWLIKIK